MTLFARRVDVPPKALRVALSLANEPGFAFLWTATGDGPSYVACRPIGSSNELDPEPGLGLCSSTDFRTKAPRWIGVLPYESTRELERAAWTKRPDRRAQPHVLAPSWRRYGAVVRVERDVIVIGDDRDEIARTAELVARPGDSDPFSIAALGPGEPDALHAERIRKTIELILEGDVYLVNIARRFDFEVRGRPVDLVARLAAHARAPFAAALQWDDVALAASSPELFLDVAADGRLATAPIKGTRPRGADAREDSRLVRELAQDPKEIAELTMVVDVERNDLGRIAEIGSVRLRGDPVVRSFGPVHHRIATVTARLRAGVSRAGLLESMLPSGSVTGAPKVRAMEIIADLESARRGLYTGAFGYVSHEGAMRLGMAIRTLTIQDGIGHYFAGGGIVVGSDPDREVLETRWKASQMGRLLERIPRDA